MPSGLPNGPVAFAVVPEDIVTTAALEQWARRLSDGKRSALLLAYPSAATFEDYDIVLVVDGCAVAGWQCKTTRGYPTRDAPVHGASWIMNTADYQASVVYEVQGSSRRYDASEIVSEGSDWVWVKPNELA